MIFNSLAYVLFLPVVLLLMGITSVKCRWLVLLGAGFWFYMWWNPKLVILLLLAMGISYICARIIGSGVSKGVRTAALVSALLSLLVMLFVFKYYDFFLESTSRILALFGREAGFVTRNIVLPVGISFYTFQTLSYVIDVYRGTVEAEKNFLRYALFVSFFPQLVAGPIERTGDLLPQLKTPIRFRRENVVPGLARMMVGYFKKVAVADTIAVYVENVYDNPGGQSGLTVLLATLLFSVQIYCDFSGYSDIAVGTARLMGIRLTENFTQPYFADSIRRFWDRWHRSLSGWLKDYLYIPLGGSRGGRHKTRRNLLVVFLASGLWHGADVTFVVWGALHGIARIVEDLLWPARKRLEETLPPVGRLLWGGLTRLLTFGYVSFAWIFFRADSMGDAFSLVRTLFGEFSLGAEAVRVAFQQLALNGSSLLLVVGLLLLLFVYDLGVSRHPGEDILLDGSVAEGRVSVRLAVLFWMVLCAAMVQTASGGAGTFLYFQF